MKIRAHFVYVYLLKELIQLLSGTTKHVDELFVHVVMLCVALSELCYHQANSTNKSKFCFPIYLSHYQYSWNKTEMEVFNA